MASDIIKLYVSNTFLYAGPLNLYNAPLFESEIAEKFLTVDNRECELYEIWFRMDAVFV